jgi:hypothetical protein
MAPCYREHTLRKRGVIRWRAAFLGRVALRCRADREREASFEPTAARERILGQLTRALDRATLAVDASPTGERIVWPASRRRSASRYHRRALGNSAQRSGDDGGVYPGREGS